MVGRARGWQEHGGSYECETCQELLRRRGQHVMQLCGAPNSHQSQQQCRLAMPGDQFGSFLAPPRQTQLQLAAPSTHSLSLLTPSLTSLPTCPRTTHTHSLTPTHPHSLTLSHPSPTRPTIFEDLEPDEPSSKGRITAMTLAEGLDRRKVGFRCQGSGLRA